MPLLSSLPDPARLGDLFTVHKAHTGPLLTYIDSVMRSDGPLDIATRELIAAYVSGLNACDFCYGSHRVYAEAFGIEEGVIKALIDDLDTAPVDEALKPLLGYVAKLKDMPPRLTEADVQKVFAAGWDEAALMQALHVAGVFHLMNRLVEGSGVNFDYSDTKSTPEDLNSSYLDFARRLGVK